MKLRTLKAVIILGGLLLFVPLLGACSSGDDDSDDSTGGQAAQSAQAAPTASSSQPEVTTAPSAPSAVAAAQFAMEPESGMPQYGGILRLSQTEDPRSLNMLDNVSSTTGSTLQGVYDRLVNWKWEGGSSTWKEIAPGIAKSWDTTNGGLTWTFKLRNDVVFHDGTPLTSADVKATLDHYNEPPSDRRPPARSYVGNFVDTVDAPDPYTVVLNLGAPAAVLLQNLSAGWVNIVSKKDIDENGLDWFITNANGTGPYKWAADKWERGVSYELDRNDNYWQDGLPYLDGKSYTVISSSSLLQAAFETGKIDMVSSTAVGNIDDIVKKLGDQMRVVQGPGGSPGYALLNTKLAPFDDERVRQAVYLWLDRDALAAKTLQGEPGFVGSWFESNTFAGNYGTPLDELRKKDLAYAKDKTAARQKAMEILAAAGYDDLSQYKINVISRGNRPTGATTLGSQVIASQLQEMGFNVQFSALEQLAAVEKFKSGEGWHATHYTSSLPYPAPEAMLGRYLGSTGQRNYSGLVDTTIDDLSAKITAATNETDRRNYIVELEDYLSEGKNATFFMYFTGVRFLEQNWLHGRRFVSSWFAQYDERAWLDDRAPSR